MKLESMVMARRTILLLTKVSSFHGQWFGVSEIADRAKLAKSTTHRYLAVFVELGILDYEPMTQKYKAMSNKK